eukprot:TRINITY_DN588_c1_g1_i1.p1 TRINITY_DN588_c1_g1~~TRINITY_DN588_c1_g1_i1.p1  ORF type:complete len:413 (+),score=50.71 TRINITY_DN588_c1_g1_i1:124-1362(+)
MAERTPLLSGDGGRADSFGPQLDASYEYPLKSDETVILIRQPATCFNSWMRASMAAMMFFGLTVVYLLRVNLSMAIIPMSKQYGWDSEFQGILLSSFFWGYVCTQILGGFMATKLGGKYVFAFGLLGSSIFTVLLPLIDMCPPHMKQPLYVTARILTGLCEGVSYPTVHNLISRWFGETERNMYLAIIWGGSFVGTMASLVFSGPIINHLGWEYVFWLFGALGGLWLLLWLIFASSGPEGSRFISLAELQTIQRDQKVCPKSKEPVPWGFLLTSRPVWALIIAYFCGTWSFYTSLMWLPTYMNEELHYDLESSGLFSFLPSLANLVTQVFAGKLADYVVSTRRFSKTLVRKSFATLAVGFGSLTLAGLCLRFRPEICVGLLVVGSFFSGFGIGGMSVNHMDLAPDLAGVLYG